MTRLAAVGSIRAIVSATVVVRLKAKLFIQFFFHLHDCINYSPIGAATTKIATHQLLHFLPCAGLPFSKQSKGTTDLAWCTVPTLESIVFDKSLLQRM
ncbi:hypothetical protein D3C73_1425440 [compost metagenome]